MARIPLIGGPLDGKAWEMGKPAPPLVYGNSFGDEKNTVYELRRYPNVGSSASPHAYIATTLTLEEAENRLAAHFSRTND